MKYIITLFVIIFGQSVSWSQLSKANIVLIIDNQLVTQNIEMNFVSENKKVESFIYGLGNVMSVNDTLLTKDDLHLDFEYSIVQDDHVKNYKYNFKFKSGWIKNTSYIVIRVYNLDKEEFKKAFCKETSSFVVEIQNQNYKQESPVCKTFLRF